jgi:deazaflavin-dependent oxidoreductase (nitroreductase family)
MTELGALTISPRVAIHEELEETRQAFHVLIAALNPSDWYLPTATHGWTIGDSLYHVIMGLQFIVFEATLIRKGLWYPKPPTSIFVRINPYLTHMIVHRYNLQTVAREYDRWHAVVVKTLESVREDEWERGNQFPHYDPPLLDGFITLKDLFHYAKQHFEAHQEDIHMGLAVLQTAATQPPEASGKSYKQPEEGWLSYPPSYWHRLLFKAPITLWRLGLGWLVGWVLMLITHTGRKTGLPRRTMVEYHSLNGVKYAPCAFGVRSDWYRNVALNPYVVIQTLHRTERAKAIRVTDNHELLRVFALFLRRDPPLTKAYLQSLGIQPEPAAVLANKDRIYWLRFDPTDEPTPQPLKADLAWIWLLALAGGLFAWLFNRRGKAK